VVPRWEWRTFGDLDDEDPAFASLRAEPAAESHDSYVLSMYGDASVKVRAGLLDAKILQRVNRAGLQLWVPTMKAGFPIDHATLVAVFEALGAPLPTTPRARTSREELLDDLVGARSDLRVVETRKRRRRSQLDGCMVELSDFTVDGRTTRTVAAESPDPDLVIRTVRRLGLEGRRNTCVAAGLKSLLDWAPRRFAVIDVGTNSVKFLLGERRDAGESSIEVDTAIVTRLGEGLAEAGELSPTAIGRTVDAIEGLVTDARQGGPVSIVAVGTAGLRQAANSDAFLQAVHDRCGVTVEVISGVDEARMAYRAAVSALPLSGDRLLVFDSGGGSTQFTLGTATGIDEQFSVDVGAVRAAEQFGLADAVPRRTVDAALRAIAEDLDRLRHSPRPDMVIAIGGTATNLAAHLHRLTRYDPAIVHGTVVDLAEVDRQIETYRQLSADARRDLPGLQPARAEVILAGACIARTVLTHTGQHAMTVSDRGLRHGVAVDRFGGELGSQPST
jgi:exopolyphosphatase/guanosine-5'-triphosphate,3'-diphosphate pyrophosphatase